MNTTLIEIGDSTIHAIEEMEVFKNTNLSTTEMINILLVASSTNNPIQLVIEEYQLSIDDNNNQPVIEVSFSDAIDAFNKLEQVSFDGQNDYLAKLGHGSMVNLDGFRNKQNYVLVLTRFILFNCDIRVNGIRVGTYRNKQNYTNEIVTQYGEMYGESIIQEANLEMIENMFPDVDSRLTHEINKAVSERKLKEQELRKVVRENNLKRIGEEREKKQYEQKVILQGRKMITYREAVAKCPDDIFVGVTKTNSSVIKPSIVSVWAFDNGFMINTDVNQPECYVCLSKEHDRIRFSKSNVVNDNPNVILCRKVSSIDHHRFNIKFFTMFKRDGATKTTKEIDDVLYAVEHNLI
ncbi:hypothetical protein [Vibrio harveyi]|uniref:hypothetical protein n=1 Tax=Vibrio harveyi TaxID=669 RepID=UPI0004193C56|nr:hypothetical protein [Vibrio harveyi]